MAKINFECIVPAGDTIQKRVSFIVIGDTAEEIAEKANSYVATIGAIGGTYSAVGLQNSKADWEAVYGPTDPRNYFQDYRPDPPAPVLKKKWYQFWK